jgi:hypothetical protein
MPLYFVKLIISEAKIKTVNGCAVLVTYISMMKKVAMIVRDAPDTELAGYPAGRISC